MRDEGDDSVFERGSEINLLTIEALEREGLADAVNALGRVLNGDGAAKHGVQGWRDRSREHHRKKAHAHLDSDGLDDDSGEPGAAHAALRALMMAQEELDE
jgi:hypothetical protein